MWSEGTLCKSLFQSSFSLKHRYHIFVILIKSFCNSTSQIFLFLFPWQPCQRRLKGGMSPNCIPTLNEIIFNPPILEDFLIENKQNKLQVIQLLQVISHDLFNGRRKDSKVYQMIVGLVAQIVHYFKLSLIELEKLFSFEFNKPLYELLLARNSKAYSEDYFRLFLRHFGSNYALLTEEHKSSLDGMLRNFWNDPNQFSSELLFEDLQNYFVNGCKGRNEIYKLFKIKPSQFLLDALQNETFGLPWFVKNYSSTNQLSSNEREFFFQLIKSPALFPLVDQVLGMILKGSVDFFNSKCFMEVFFTKLLIADYAVIGEAEERLVKGNENLFKECVNFFLNMNSAQLENFKIFPFFPVFRPKNHLFLFFLAIARFNLEHLFPTLDFILPSICHQLPIITSPNPTTSSTKKVLLSGLEYETFNFQQFIQLHISCTNDPHWKLMKQIFQSLSSINHPDNLIESLGKDLKSQLASILLFGGIYWLEKKEYSKSFSFLSSSLKHSIKQYPFPQLKFVSFCKNALFEVSFVLVNEIQQPQNLPLVCNVIHLLNDQIPTNCYRIVFLCANLINHKLENFAIDFAKNFLHVAGKRKDQQKQTISLLKMLYNSCICVSLFGDKYENDSFSDWSPKHISLLVNASDSLFRNISGDEDIRNLFIGFLSLLERSEDCLNDFVGLFIGSLNATLPETDLICLKYFSKYALFYAKHSSNNAKFSSPTASIESCNQQLSSYYRPTLEKKDDSQFNCSSLKNVIVLLYEKPTSIDYFYSKSSTVLGFGEIVFLQRNYHSTIIILIFHLMTISNYFSTSLESINNFSFICERIASCFWKLGQFDDLLLFIQLLEKKSKFWYASQISKLDMLSEEMIDHLVDVDLIEYLAVVTENCQLFQQHFVKRSQDMNSCNRNEIGNRILKFISTKYLGF